ncbi:hypothetical protein [Marinigracilibium pacificum]|uniref:Uncharacterized protein n=1 Tax=Marinigracilibium pacificum TaxID=2729599 RepID=A0A848ISJ9_9BACT|nr:hypothetical protein [Marinigracilibium pacificum]NMM47317.1 hypothetical protein [Marinigracilibium pacificum]
MRYFSIFVVLLCVIACKKDDEEIGCIEKQFIVIENAGAPATARIGDQVNIIFNMTLSQACQSFTELKSIEDGNTTYIDAKGEYDACIGCAQILIPVEATYQFSPKSKGVYNFIVNTETPDKQFSFSITIN